MNEYGIFCEIYGKTLRNLMLEHFLTMDELDYAVSDLSKDINISRTKAYELVEEFLEEGILKKTRIIGKTQLYSLDSNNKTKLLKKSFNECLNLLAEEHSNEWIEFAKKQKLSREIFNELRNLLPN